MVPQQEVNKEPFDINILYEGITPAVRPRTAGVAQFLYESVPDITGISPREVVGKAQES